MIRRVVPDFIPSRNGFHFANCFPPEPVLSIRVPGWRVIPIGDASGGLCGGMAFAVRDLFEAGRYPPSIEEPPPAQSQLFHFLARRLIHSFNLPIGPVRYYVWMTLPERGNGVIPGVLDRTASEWRKVKAEIDSGRLAVLGLVRTRSWNPWLLGKNHQVVAYGYELYPDEDRATLYIYDPNYPDEDELTMKIDLRGQKCIEYSTGECVRGFFRTWYRKKHKPPPDPRRDYKATIIVATED